MARLLAIWWEYLNEGRAGMVRGGNRSGNKGVTGRTWFLGGKQKRGVEIGKN